jgi:post-segregation antitoxin (ccd killing protein)
MIFVSSHQPQEPRPKEGRKTTKISVTMPNDVVDEVRKRAQGNVSRWITEAVEREIEAEIRHERLREMIEEYKKEHGPFTEEEMEQAKSEWPDAKEFPWPDE